MVEAEATNVDQRVGSPLRDVAPVVGAAWRQRRRERGQDDCAGFRIEETVNRHHSVQSFGGRYPPPLMRPVGIEQRAFWVNHLTHSLRKSAQ
jgi:hypothetical protein